MSIITDIYQELLSKPQREGKVADYIPELAKVDSNKFGIYLCKLTGEEEAAGDFEERFSIQSISKVFSLAHVVSLLGGEAVWKRIGVEPSGNPFNSIVQLEYEQGIPRNPFINAGAIVMADMLLSHLDDPETEFLDFVRKMAGNEDIKYNKRVVESELAYGFKNAALINMLKFYGNIHNDIDRVLRFYYQQCSIEMSCVDLARAFSAFANHGKLFEYNKTILSISQVKRINAIMQTCGFYDEAGEFSFRVGLPGKSGVGGGIVAVHPGQYSVAVWSPLLNKKGNSILGMQFLEELTTRLGISIF